ncbi:MAG TPA: iron uptake transporter deferrochelatase/peroxidase subunit [Stellaceae bacterium]|nr:iron uptake transporter deferrochelatase/peroxidase subunit [Stellaceae bacterium]
MTESDNPAQPSRRRFLGATGSLVALGSTSYGSAAPTGTPKHNDQVEPFWGPHQAGIVTPAQRSTYFAAFDLAATKRADVIAMLKAWTNAAARLTAGKPAATAEASADMPGADTADTMGLPPSRLTVTFGFGPGLFVKDGKDRYGLAAQRPEAFVDLPRFVGDQLVATHTGGDVSVQACADDPQVAFHAVRQLGRLSYDAADLRWTQTGFMPDFGPGERPRNLMGFKDGTNNPSITDAAAMDKVVWVGSEGPDWMRGGSYLVARRIRIALEHWDRMKVGFQEQTVGRHKYSGAPLGRTNEKDALDLDAKDEDGNLLTPENAHVRLATATTNDGAQILRRPYSYNDGTNFTAERWPPWRQANEYDAGLFFMCYQRDPRTGFIKIFENMSKFDMMNQFVTHVGGGMFACPGGIASGEYVGQRLFETA